ncbi:uncharacterized protein LOC121298608 [Polyodon spathula]|uniref:uncharacterized protein LOC121298608 n=1 Tax=Polyodon spathula TaxID=7913 RepID=UPI001B7D97BB|nr:uncharacterized protein LOC121298608 [Polyodon spathula]
MEKQLCDLLVCLILLSWGFGAGVAGLELYSSLGETVTLPCGRFQEYQNSFIYWVFSQRSETASELASGGKITVKQPERAARLEVLPDSSLRIHDLHIEDSGQYTCQQYVNEQFHSSQASVFLKLLTITAVPGGDLKRGTALSLQCALVCNGGIADCSPPVNAELTWVDDEGTALQGDRFKITKYRTHSTLSLQLQKSDHNRRWRCNLTEGGEVKASFSYTTTLTDTPVLIASSSSAAVTLLLVLILAVAFCAWKRKRTDSNNHVQAEELKNKESVSEIPARVTGGAEENYSSIRFDDERRGPERRQAPAEESKGVIYSAIK